MFLVAILDNKFEIFYIFDVSIPWGSITEHLQPQAPSFGGTKTRALSSSSLCVWETTKQLGECLIGTSGAKALL